MRFRRTGEPTCFAGDNRETHVRRFSPESGIWSELETADFQRSRWEIIRKNARGL